MIQDAVGGREAHLGRSAALNGPGPSDAEVAFYDALATHEQAMEVLGDDMLKTIAREAAETAFSYE